MTPFAQFLKLHSGANSPRGDLIQDLLEDHHLPDVTSKETLLGYLRRKGACREAIKEAELLMRDFAAFKAHAAHYWNKEWNPKLGCEYRTARVGSAIFDRRAFDNTGTQYLRGYAADFNSLSQDLGGFREQIAPGAFAEALTGDVRLLINHQGLPLARTASRTLTLKEDNHGLLVEARLDPADPDVAALMPHVKSFDPARMAFGLCFRSVDQIWTKNEQGENIRTLTAIDVCDLSIVVWQFIGGTRLLASSGPVPAWSPDPFAPTA